MKENIWQALINKEESRSIEAKTRLEDVLGQCERIARKKQYLNDILSEYSRKLDVDSTVTGQEGSLSISAYMLQLFKIKENLQTEEDELSVIISENRQVLARHSQEIYKYSKLKSVAVKSRLAAEIKLESRHQDESNVIKYNIDRRFSR
jgi:flagellar biosynthesis chaperone FliJ